MAERRCGPFGHPSRREEREGASRSGKPEGNRRTKGSPGKPDGAGGAARFHRRSRKARAPRPERRIGGARSAPRPDARQAEGPRRRERGIERLQVGSGESPGAVPILFLGPQKVAHQRRKCNRIRDLRPATHALRRRGRNVGARPGVTPPEARAGQDSDTRRIRCSLRANRLPKSVPDAPSLPWRQKLRTLIHDGSALAPASEGAGHGGHELVTQLSRIARKAPCVVFFCVF